MRKLKTTTSLLAVLLMSVCGVQADEYYTWVDENGVVNYSERDPEGYDAQLVNSQRQVSGKPREFGYRRPTREPEPPAPPPADEDAQEPGFGENGEGLDPEIDAEIAAEKARVEEAIAKVKRSNCAIGKRNLAQLEAYARVRVKDDDGTERMLTDQEKQARIQKARQTIRENCTG